LNSYWTHCSRRELSRRSRIFLFWNCTPIAFAGNCVPTLCRYIELTLN